MSGWIWAKSWKETYTQISNRLKEHSKNKWMKCHQRTSVLTTFHDWARPVTFSVQECPTALLGWAPLGGNWDRTRKDCLSRLPEPSTGVTAAGKNVPVNDRNQQKCRDWRSKKSLHGFGGVGNVSQSEVGNVSQSERVIGTSTKVLTWLFQCSPVLHSEKHSRVPECVKAPPRHWQSLLLPGRNTCTHLQSLNVDNRNDHLTQNPVESFENLNFEETCWKSNRSSMINALLHFFSENCFLVCFFFFLFENDCTMRQSRAVTGWVSVWKRAGRQREWIHSGLSPGRPVEAVWARQLRHKHVWNQQINQLGSQIARLGLLTSPDHKSSPDNYKPTATGSGEQSFIQLLLF